MTGLFAGGYVGAWVGSVSGAGVGMLFAMVAGGDAMGYRDPAFSFIETLVTTGLLAAILGTLSGIALGAALGASLGALVAMQNSGPGKRFVQVACIAACMSAMLLAAAMLRWDVDRETWRPLGANQMELVARVAAICVVGVGGLFGGALLGRILREVAWEPGIPRDVAGRAPGSKME